MNNNSIFARLNPVFEWVIYFATNNLLWILFNLPIFYLALLVLLVPDTSQMFMLFVTIAVLAPFMFFPATTALFGVTRKWKLKEEVKVFRFFLKYYKENYKRSLSGGFIITFLWVVGITDYFYFKANLPIVSFIFLLLLVVLFLYTLYFFAHTVHTEEKLRQSLKNVLIISIANPIFSFGIAAICIAVGYLSFTYLSFLLPFFTGSVIAFIAVTGYLKVFNSLMLLQQSNSEEK